MSLDRPEKNSGREQAVGPGFFSAGKLKSVDIRKFVIDCLRKNQYELLERELRERGFFEKNKAEKFFLKQGEGILSYALRAECDKPLRFLTDESSIVSKQTLKTVLKKDDFSVLSIFLHEQVGLESMYRPTPDSTELQIKKFKILLDIDDGGVKNFMQQTMDNQYLQTESIKQNFSEAERQFEADNSFSNVITRPPADF